MEHLQNKPFFLNDEDILWVGNTLADLSDEKKIELLIITQQSKLPFAPVGCTNASRVKALQNAGFAALVVDFPGDEVDVRETHLVSFLNTFSFDQWEKSYGAGYASCINEGAMAFMVAPIIFPGYIRMIDPRIREADIPPATVSAATVTDLLKKKLHFNGIVVADGVKTEEIPQAIAAGCDMFFSCGSREAEMASMKKGLAEGIITQARLREAVVQILGLKAALGLYL